ncbi:MAG: cytochrome c, partial [Acidimicrobiia bacterium]
GGGPLNEQQVGNIIEYIKSFQLTPEETRSAIEGELRSQLGLDEDEEIDYGDDEVGEALFNLGRSSGFAGGAYSCGRCHTRGWSINEASAQPSDADLDDYVGFPDGSGAYGFSLRYPVIPRQFLNIEELVDFIATGTEHGARYGQNGQGNGKMPGFGDNPNTVDSPDDGMMSPEMIEAIADYVRELGRTSGEEQPTGGGSGTSSSRTTTTTTER